MVVIILMIGENNMNSKPDIKKYILQFFRWVISNTIWTIVTLAFPAAFIIAPITTIVKSILNKTYTINLLTVLVIIIFFIIETILFIGIVFVKHKDKAIIQDDNIDYDKLDYYFESYHKHLTVYKNGNGIMISSFTVIINDINSIQEFKRELDISDAKYTTRFPKLNKMKSEKLNNRFNNFGFWCKCLNNKDLIKSVREFYWSDNSQGIDTISQSDPKIIKWIMEMNPSSIEVGTPYNIVYVISVPGMFPIQNGLFLESIANIKGTQGKFQSRFGVKHEIKNFTYTVSFENGLVLKNRPSGSIVAEAQKNNLHYTNDNNIIYDKYIFNTEKPKVGSVINIEWVFKSQKANTGNHVRR